MKMKLPRQWWAIGAALVMAVVVLVIYLLTAISKNPITGKCRHLNLMVITLDTMRADRIGAYGYPAAETPNLDGLAANGILFENCYAPVPITLPAHCSLFTGRYPLAHRVRGNGTYLLKPGEITLAEKMKEQGFQTYALIASFVLMAKFGLNQGFDLYDDSLQPDEILTNFFSEIKADQVYTRFHHWFENSRSPREKFFAWIHFYDPHLPYNPPAKYKKKSGDDIESLYDGEVAFVDVFIGKIIHDLKTANLLEQTLVVIVGDHGEAFGEHQEYGHTIFGYEQNLKVPLVFYNPRVFPGKLKGLRVKNRVNLIDIMPTILELYGQEIPGEIHGRGFAHLLTGHKEKKERTFYIESMHGKEELGWAPLTGIIHEQYKYISLPEPELYDLAIDSNEKHNLFLEKNRLARDLDKKLQDLVSTYAAGTRESRRQLSETDAKHLQTLGYISAFSNKTGTNLDPKKGIIVENRFLEIKKTIDKGNLDQAEARLQEIKQNNPDTPFPRYFILTIDILKRKKDREGVIRTWQEAIAAFPGNINFKGNLAFELLHLNRLEAAENLANEMIKNNPQETRAYILKGRSAEKKDRIPEALAYFEKALTLEPRNVSLKVSYARLLAENQNYRKAGEICEELLIQEAVVKKPQIKTRIGIILTEIYKNDLAFKVLTEVNEAGGIDAEAWNYLGILYYRKKLYDRALEAYRQSIKLDPGMARTYNNLGTLFLTLFIRDRDPRVIDRAIAAFNKALDLDPALFSALNGRASAYKFGSRVRGALDEWKKIIAVKPGFIDAYFNLGITYLQIHQKKEALKYLNRLKENFYKQLPGTDRQRLDRLILQAGG
jgi:arylsulfatase A-like enzyme/Flp pilus assembly protein TadD